MHKNNTLLICALASLCACRNDAPPPGESSSTTAETLGVSESANSSESEYGLPDCDDCPPNEVCANVGHEWVWTCSPPGDAVVGAPCEDGTDCNSGVCLPFPFFKQSACNSPTCCGSLCPCTVTEVCTDLGPVDVCREG